MSVPEDERRRLTAETESLLELLPGLPPSSFELRNLPYLTAHAHWTRIANLIKDAVEWLSIHAGQSNAFASKPWLLLQLSGDTRAARAWPIPEVERDLKFVRTILITARLSETGAASADLLAPGGSDYRRPRGQGAERDEDRRLALAAHRRLVVTPILDSKGWSRSKWASEGGVGKSGVYEYLDGKRKLSPANRKALAEVLGRQSEDLPE